MVDEKREKEAIKQHRVSQIEMALKNSVTQLRKMGITSVKVDISEDGSTGYIVFSIEDIVKLIQGRCRTAVKKTAGKNLEVVAYTEDDVMVVRVRK